MTKRPLQFPDSIRKMLRRRYAHQRRHWLGGGGDWPLVVTLGDLSETAAARQVDFVRAWIGEWQDWRGTGTLEWQVRHWRTLGVQRLPGRLRLDSAEDVAAWLGETNRWSTARDRYQRLSARWPLLKSRLTHHFNVLADYCEGDFNRLEALLAWLNTNPKSNLYPRQLPIAGLDSKWLESRKGLVTDLMTGLRQMDPALTDVYQCCGLRPVPNLIHMRILDPALREGVGGLGDITAPVNEMAELTLPIQCAFIVENLQTGLAFEELPGTVILMGLGYGVDLLAGVRWLQNVTSFYWGDIDTHGFAILSRARSHLPGLKSLLMDEQTLLRHKTMWVEEKQQHPADRLADLTDGEQSVYCALKQHRWGLNVRLEQERVSWPEAWKAVQRVHHLPESGI